MRVGLVRVIDGCNYLIPCHCNSVTVTKVGGASIKVNSHSELTLKRRYSSAAQLSGRR